MRFLGLDIGEKRIGVALSDEGGMLARPLMVIWRKSRQDDFGCVEAIVKEWDVKQVVVGLPLTLEGEVGPQARRVKRYVRDLARVLSVPVVFFDESYSTADALEIMGVIGHSREKRQERVDAVAAAVILQRYLDCGDLGAAPREVLDGET